MTLWTILIATQARRGPKLSRLLGVLLPQVEEAAGAVTIEALHNNGERPVGQLRQSLLEHATSEYVSFVDDDDEVPPYFIGKVLPLLDGVDYIGWRMQAYYCGFPLKPTYHSLEYSTWHEDSAGYYRDISHLNPVRRALTVGTSYCFNDHEDSRWADQVRSRVKTQHFIPEVMYHYWHDPDDSVQHGVIQGTSSQGRITVDSSFFSWHPEST